MTHLTFDMLRDVNARRAPLFKNAHGVVVHPGGIDDWSPSEWTNALCGEAGEAANFAKKYLRGDFPPGPEGEQEFKEKIGRELADVVCYADLCAQRVGVNLGFEVIRKFNEVSEKVGVDIFLPTPEKPKSRSITGSLLRLIGKDEDKEPND